MNQLLSHLPEDKQKDIAEIVEVIKDIAEPEKILLYGSFARGNWVDDEYVENGITYTYLSDFDFMVVTNGSRLKEFEIKSKINNRTKKYRHPVSVNVHEMDHVNYGLERGQYFFAEIVKEGIELFDTGNFQFADARPLSVEEQLEEAEYYYKKWIESGVEMLENTKIVFQNALVKGYKSNNTMFLLHQTAEKLYAGLGLVFTGYKPKTHSIQEYQNHVKSISDKINKLFCFPPDNQEEDRLFTILQKSYIDARYKDDYFVERVDVEKLIEKIENLERIVVELSQQRINSLKA